MMGLVVRSVNWRNLVGYNTSRAYGATVGSTVNMLASSGSSPPLPAPSDHERDLPTTGTELDDLLRNLLQHDPSRRLVAHDCISHGYFRTSALQELRGSGELQDARARLQAIQRTLELARETNGWQRHVAEAQRQTRD